MTGRSLGITGLVLALGGVLLIGAGSLVAAGATAGQIAPFGGNGMMGGGYGGDGSHGGMMRGGSWDAGPTSAAPGETGFVAGTPDAPRVVRILATPDLRFSPDTVRVQAGETIRFDVTTMGPVAHEFMVGPAADVAADREGTPEIADITMMHTGSVTYTFSGAGPFAFACHAEGHYEAGMAGTIVIVG